MRLVLITLTSFVARLDRALTAHVDAHGRHLAGLDAAPVRAGASMLGGTRPFRATRPA